MADSEVDLVICQEILRLFQEQYEEILQLPEEELRAQIQSVKSALFDRDYATAFGSFENLLAYVVRWSPSRALSYYHLFMSLKAVRSVLCESENDVRVLSIGGGAGAELVASAAAALCSKQATSKAKIHFTAVDVAEWEEVVKYMTSYIDKYWSLWIPGGEGNRFSVDVVCNDVLALPPDDLQLSSTQLITCMFTTNELFASSKAGTVKFLQSLSVCPKGALLLIVESAGSYSEIEVGSKKFPVQFLLQHTLTRNDTWKIIESDDSRWYRVPKELKYKLKLENMRFFIKLYERT